MRIKRVTTADAGVVVAGPDAGNLTGASTGCYADNDTRNTALIAINALGTLATSLKNELNGMIVAAKQLGIQGLALVTAADASTVISGNNNNEGNNAGGFNDATARDLAITQLGAMVTLANEIEPDMTRVVMALAQSGALPGNRATALAVGQAVQGAMTAGGTGANTGGFLGSTPRATALTAINTIGTLLNDVKAKLMFLQQKLQINGLMQ